MYRSILVAVDGSEFSIRAARHAGLLAKMVGAKLVLFHVVPHHHTAPVTEGLSIPTPQPSTEELRRGRETEARKVLQEARKDIPFSGGVIEEEYAVSNQPYEAIIERAKKLECDLIVMAPHGHRGIAGVLLGSETQKVLTHSPLPVLVVR